jgi:sugar phosphate permease
MEHTFAEARPGEPARGRRWLILGIGVAAQAASCSFLYGLPFVVPSMRQEGLTLAQAGVLVAAPTVGVLLTLIAWGAAADRFGERAVMALGLGASGAVLGAGALGAASGPALFAVFLAAGAASASVNAASGRVVMGWFEPGQRGVAMGVRQAAQPLGVGIAALGLPPLAGAWGMRPALLLPAGLALLAAAVVALLCVDPPRTAGAAGRARRSPYRAAALWRLHGASALLVVPQFAVSAFAPVYLVATRHWSPVWVGAFLAGVQALGALGRLAAGYVSDRVGSRLRPMRRLAVASAGAMLLVAAGDAGWPWLAVPALVVAAVLSVSDNGLGFTASAELAGAEWAGRAMGAQNTAQNIAASVTPPVLGMVIGDARFALAFCVAAVPPLLAIAAVPVAAESVAAGPGR